MKLGGGVRIARVHGIDVRVHWSWLIIAGLLVWSLAEGVFGARNGWGAGERWAAALVTSAFFFLSLLLHELSHSLVAQRLGIRVRSITLFVFGGVSALTDEMPSAGREFRVAVAGPLMSWALGALFGLVWLGTRSMGVAPMFGYLALINLALGVFNLLPGFPLDGGRVLRALLWARTHSLRRATAIAGRAGAAIGIAFIGLGLASAVLFGFLAGVWYVLIGYFLFAASRGTAEAQAVDEILEGAQVASVMRTPAPTIAGSATLAQLAEVQQARAERAEIVESAGGAAGVITTSDVVRRPSETWSRLRVDEVMVPVAQLVTIDAGSSLRVAMQLMNEHAIHQLPVARDGRIVGMLTSDDVGRFVRTHAELASS